MKKTSKQATSREAQESSVHAYQMGSAHVEKAHRYARRIGHTAQSRRRIAALIMKTAAAFNAESITYAAR